VAVDGTTGTVTLTTTDGVSITDANRLVESGDGGDTYNYSPPKEDIVVDTPEFVRVSTLESGPVRSRLRVDAVYSWPANAVGDAASCSRRADHRVQAEVHTTYELRAHERFVRVRVELDHRVRDHRLRAHFPLPARIFGSDAECAFAVVRRPLVAEGGPHEPALATYVSRRFVDCSNGEVGLAVLHDGLLEYEVVRKGKELALTLLRATGYLSRSAPSLRPLPAGPLWPVEGAQLQKPIALEYALLPHRGDWQAAELYAQADEFLVPFLHAPAGHHDDDDGDGDSARAASGRALTVEGAVVSAVQRDAGGVTVRLFNPLAGEVTASLDHNGAPAAGWVVDLLGAPLEAFDGKLDLRPAEIVTLRLG
jgi:alpha-mannosidase